MGNELACRPAATERQTARRFDPEKRLEVETTEIDVGEQIIGSSHPVDIKCPLNGDPNMGSATVAAFVESGSETFTAPLAFVQVAPRVELFDRAPFVQPGQATAVRIYCHPKAAGQSVGVIRLLARWPDGHTEHARVRVTVNARDLETPPKAEVPSPVGRSPAEQVEELTATAQVALDQTRTDAPPENARNALQLATDDARRAAGSVFEHQKNGLDLVAQESGIYKAPKHESPWFDLAELAIMLGSSGIASLITKALEPELVALFKSRRDWQDFKRINDGVNVDRTEAFEAPAIVKTITGYVEKTVKKGAERSIKQAIGEAKKKGSQSTSTAGAHSADSVIDFFATQRNALGDARDQVDSEIGKLNERMHAVLRTDQPELAGAGMRKLSEALRLGAAVAEREQATAASQAWVSFVARGELGSEKAGELEDAPEVTKLDGRETRGSLWESPSLGQVGLLEVYVQGIDNPTVTGARLNGVAASLVERVRTLDLRSARMPIRFVVDESTFVTRDEAGRVRIGKGAWAFSDDKAFGTSEEQAHRGAQRLVDAVVAKSLEAWGICVANDDTSERGRAIKCGA